MQFSKQNGRDRGEPRQYCKITSYMNLSKSSKIQFPQFETLGALLAAAAAAALHHLDADVGLLVGRQAELLDDLVDPVVGHVAWNNITRHHVTSLARHNFAGNNAAQHGLARAR